MKDVKTLAPLIALAVCYALFFTYVLNSQGELPARVASHFDIQGRPNGWMSRDVCIYFTLGLGIFMPAFIVGMMALTRWIPVNLVNLPNREYWLAPERRKETSALLLHFGLWFACMNVLFVTGLHWLIVQSNGPGQAPQLSTDGITFVAGGFLAGTIVWTILLLLRFSQKN